MKMRIFFNVITMDLNRAQIIGRVTQDPELRQTPSGQSVVSFSVATNRSWKDSSGEQKYQTEFHNIVAWGKLAEIIGNYAKKGKRVYVEGRLQTRSWEDNNGEKHRKTEIVADNLILLDGGSRSEYVEEPPIVDESSKEEEKQSNEKHSDDDISIEDVPF
jgi:single-strand DNA-binding protein